MTSSQPASSEIGPTEPTEGTLVAIDVSNSATAIALWRDAVVATHWRISTDSERTPDEHGTLIRRLFEDVPAQLQSVRGVVLACVVPELEPTFVETSRAVFGLEPLVVGPGVHTGVPVRTENPREVGADRIANAASAFAQYGGPVIVVDMSTTLTFDIVDAAGAYIGAVIAPGMDVAGEALAARTARLQRVDLVPPPRAIAADTTHAIQSGLVFGYLGLIEGLISRITDEVGSARVVATGEAPWGPMLASESELVELYDPLLTLDGLRRIFGRASGVIERCGPPGR